MTIRLVGWESWGLDRTSRPFWTASVYSVRLWIRHVSTLQFLFFLSTVGSGNRRLCAVYTFRIPSWLRSEFYLSTRTFSCAASLDGLHIPRGPFPSRSLSFLRHASHMPRPYKRSGGFFWSSKIFIPRASLIAYPLALGSARCFAVWISAAFSSFFFFFSALSGGYVTSMCLRGGFFLGFAIVTYFLLFGLTISRACGLLGFGVPAWFGIFAGSCWLSDDQFVGVWLR